MDKIQKVKILLTEIYGEEKGQTAFERLQPIIDQFAGQKRKQEVIKGYHDGSGFKNTDRLVEISQAIIHRFAEQTRDDGATPIVILFNNRGYHDHLHSILKPVLEKNNIPYYSTHEKYPASQLSNFISDGHFTQAIDESIAKSVYKIIAELKIN